MSIVTRSGIPQVKIGDEVKKGDLLVAGEVPIYNDDETIKELIKRCGYPAGNQAVL